MPIKIPCHISPPTKRCSKQSHGCSCQGCKATNHTGTLRNLPNSASRNLYTNTHRNSPETFQNPHQHTPAHTGTFRNLPPPQPTPAHTNTSTQRNSLEPSGTFLRNLPPEPAPATRTGTHRSLSGLRTPLAYAVGEKMCGIAQIYQLQKLTVKRKPSNPQGGHLLSGQGHLELSVVVLLLQLLGWSNMPNSENGDQPFSMKGISESEKRHLYTFIFGAARNEPTTSNQKSPIVYSLKRSASSSSCLSR